MKNELQPNQEISVCGTHFLLTKLPSVQSAPTDTNSPTTILSERAYHSKFYMVISVDISCSNCNTILSIHFRHEKYEDPYRCIWLNRTSPVTIPHNSCHKPQYQYAATNFILADPGGRTAKHVGQRLLGCSNCGFESRRQHGCLFLVIGVFSSRNVCEEPIPCPGSINVLCVCGCVCVCVSLIVISRNSNPLHL